MSTYCFCDRTLYSARVRNECGTQYLSSLRVCDAGVAEVTALPLGVEAVSLQLPELEGGVEGTGLHLDGDGVDNHRHALHHFLSEAILAVNTQC